jgi:hypothetical protein
MPNDSSGCGKVIAILSVIASIIAIFTFITGIVSIKDFKGTSPQPEDNPSPTNSYQQEATVALQITDTPQSVPIEMLPPKENTIIIDGLPDDWRDIDYTEIPDSELDLSPWLGWSVTQLRGIDFKQIYYFIQDENIYFLMEFYGEVNQNYPQTSPTGIGISFRNEPQHDVFPILFMDYVPEIGTELYLLKSSIGTDIQKLDLEGVRNAYNENYIETKLPIKYVQEYFSTPYFNYISYMNVNDRNTSGENTNDIYQPPPEHGLVGIYQIGDWDISKYILMMP